MANDNQGFFMLRPRFLLFCLYCMGYIALRGSGEIIHQAAEVRLRGGVGVYSIVGSNPEAPRWRRQAYRVVYSPLMVAEEEGRRLLSEGKGWMRSAGDYGRDLLD